VPRGMAPRASPAPRLRLPPPFVLALLYAVLVVIGACLLMTPWAQARPFGWSDALFTATSAVTVTGLTVIDVGADLTRFGQAVLMVLFQLGGLGLMTFAVLVLGVIGGQVGLPHRIFLSADLAQTSIRDVLRLVGVVIRFVLVVQLVGAIALAVAFAPRLGWEDALWFGAFHAVSAFNSAGFDLFGDSLEGWAADPLVNVTVPALFILGGIGFAVVADLWRVRRWRGLSFHSKIMLSGTAALLLGGFIAFTVIEWRNPATLGGIESSWARLAAGFFQAATPRSAGFATIDWAGVTDATALMTIGLMLIGGGPTSTAGGVKVSTFIVMLLALAAFFRRRDEMRAFGRSLGLDEALKVLALVAAALMVMHTAVFLLLLTHDAPFVDVAFEVASALGTVGLSRGMTAELNEFGRALVGALMFVGRVGPLTLGYFIAVRATPRVRYPAAQVYLA
jgi:trk system potassium uptake protein